MRMRLLQFVYHKSTSLATKHGGMQPSGVWKVTALVEFENFNPLSFGK